MEVGLIQLGSEDEYGFNRQRLYVRTFQVFGGIRIKEAHCL
jgi:hypothetical protein